MTEYINLFSSKNLLCEQCSKHISRSDVFSLSSASDSTFFYPSRENSVGSAAFKRAEEQENIILIYITYVKRTKIRYTLKKQCLQRKIFFKMSATVHCYEFQEFKTVKWCRFIVEGRNNLNLRWRCRTFNTFFFLLYSQSSSLPHISDKMITWRVTSLHKCDESLSEKALPAEGSRSDFMISLGCRKALHKFLLLL